jgi:CoA:oxalate CoA-transferase
VDRPLHGSRVVEVGGTLAAAAATKLFSDYGADVIKVEPRGGAEMRRLPPFPGDTPGIETGAYHVALDTGKRSLVVDVETPSGREVLGRLASTATLVVLHVPSSSTARLRAAIEHVGGTMPSTVTLAAHGVEGSYADRTENDMSLFAWTTRMRHHSTPGAEPLRYAPNVATMQWGATAAAAGVAALWARERDGRPRHMEVPGVEALLGNVDSWFLIWEFLGAEMPRDAGQSRRRYPAGCYRCADGYVLFAAGGEPFFTRLCEGIGHPELTQDPRFSDPEKKIDHVDEFMTYLQPWLDARTREEVFTSLQAHGVMVAPVYEVPEVMQDRQAVARGSYVEVETPAGGTTTIAAAPFRMDEAWRADPAPRLGEHTVELLDELGYSRPEQIALFRAGVTG